jgi:thiamine pyrophosphate-dependent acetolactate synthase large subunit-like protein
MPTLAHALLAALKDHGAHEIFGIPGDFVLPLFNGACRASATETNLKRAKWFK